MKNVEVISIALPLSIVSLLSLVLYASVAFGHCDTMSGPIIPEAQSALEKGDVSPILKWVKQEDQDEIMSVFKRTLSVRSQSKEAKELADRYFLETLIRLHRAGEGAPFTGLKDEPVEPIVAMADKALDEGSAEKMIEKLSSHMAKSIRTKFYQALEAKKNMEKSVDAGREYVEAYVIYVHSVEGIHNAMVSTGNHEQAAAH